MVEKKSILFLGIIALTVVVGTYVIVMMYEESQNKQNLYFNNDGTKVFYVSKFPMIESVDENGVSSYISSNIEGEERLLHEFSLTIPGDVKTAQYAQTLVVNQATSNKLVMDKDGKTVIIGNEVWHCTRSFDVSTCTHESMFGEK